METSFLLRKIQKYNWQKAGFTVVDKLWHRVFETGSMLENLLRVRWAVDTEFGGSVSATCYLGSDESRLLLWAISELKDMGVVDWKIAMPVDMWPRNKEPVRVLYLEGTFDEAIFDEVCERIDGFESEEYWQSVISPPKPPPPLPHRTYRLGEDRNPSIPPPPPISE